MGRKNMKSKAKKKAKKSYHSTAVTTDDRGDGGGGLQKGKKKEESEGAPVFPLRDDKAMLTKSQEVDLDKLIDKAEQLIDEFDFELSQKFCQRALEIEPDNVRALEISASLLLEMGNIESAKHCLGRAVEVSPESGFSKYMNLGQLMVGATAVQCYQKGIELMINEKQAQQAEEVMAACSDERSITDQDIASGYCAIAEIYMTDCCFDDEAEQKCIEFIDKALQVDSENIEAMQLRASFLMSKDKKEEAREVLKKSVSLWLPKLELAETKEVRDEDFNPVEVCPVPFSTRMQCGKILIEVDEHEMATDVLETLLDEDEDEPDVWYLLGWANYLQGEDYFSNARHYLERATEVYTKVKHDDAQLLSHIQELLGTLGPEPSDGTETNLEDDIQSSGGEEEEDMEVR